MFVGLFGGEIYYVQKLQCWLYDVFQVKTHVRKRFLLKTRNTSIEKPHNAIHGNFFYLASG